MQNLCDRHPTSSYGQVEALAKLEMQQMGNASVGHGHYMTPQPVQYQQ